MATNGFAQELVNFFKTARHLWGRCPQCESLFRLSEVAITPTSEPPRDWLQIQRRKESALLERQAGLDEREEELDDRESWLKDGEHNLRIGENRLERDAKQRVREILRSDTELQAAIKEASKAAVLRSRASLLGKMLERIAPCFRRFPYDPRDMRCISDPLDYVLFDGLTAEREVRQILFVEIKCGSGRLTRLQRSLRDAIAKGRVDSEVWEVGDPKIPITKQLPPAQRRILDRPAPFSLD